MTGGLTVSACLVTRGDIDMSEALAAVAAAGIGDVAIWNNALEEDEAVYGRYRAAEQARHPIVFTQDDDCVVPATTIQALLAAHRPGTIVANMPAEFRPHYTDSCLLGFGAVFDRGLPERAFARYRASGRDPRVRPDVVFTTLTPHIWLDLPVEILPEAYGPGRNYRQRGHARERQRVLLAARRVRDSRRA